VNSEFPPRKWAEVLLFIERALQLSSKREKREKTTPPDCIMPPRILRAFDLPN